MVVVVVGGVIYSVQNQRLQLGDGELVHTEAHA